MVAVCREAGLADADRITQLVNRAFLAESWFKPTDRTGMTEVQNLLNKGVFLLLEENARVLVCVYLEPQGERVYLGMLAVEKDIQGRGLGRRMMREAEDFSRHAGHKRIELRIVNVREELPPYYDQLGYVESGREPAPNFPGVNIPIHFILMSKLLES